MFDDNDDGYNSQYFYSDGVNTYLKYPNITPNTLVVHTDEGAQAAPLPQGYALMFGIARSTGSFEGVTFEEQSKIFNNVSDSPQPENFEPADPSQVAVKITDENNNVTDYSYIAYISAGRLKNAGVYQIEFIDTSGSGGALSCDMWKAPSIP